MTFVGPRCLSFKGTNLWNDMGTETKIKLSHKKSEEGLIKSNVIFIPMSDNFSILYCNYHI